MNSPNSSDFLHPELFLDPTWDALFEQSPYPKPFAFNEDVARVFDNMVSRSIPLYREAIAAAVHWTRAYYQPGTRIIDVGCSTGTLLELLGRFLAEPAILVGVDNAQAMLDKAQQKLNTLPAHHQVELVCDRAEAVSFENSSVVILNYTLQFLPVHHRQQVLNAIYSGLVPGGLLFLSEKVKSPYPRFQEQLTRHYEAFKTRNGYAQTEIERKKEALENVLVPLTEAQQIAMLHRAGFKQVEILSKFHNFLTLVAEKT
ncbi:carboxy-S-adenosyl-L-methionine synthase CmoA [Vacuolonema iberomarrocanum]|uniref:carboxy-S-adenosyl-L-methionine synthase CmoA n=1 Tax=Vacuolonema iberomarrocanum TaxID=3454632 RepID=UPI0019E6AFC1|nr:carboxy-S-adenosyl-L-methionine synthase CmoA [filamentous cyanobacterium LEGE 07170]